ALSATQSMEPLISRVSERPRQTDAEGLRGPTPFLQWTPNDLRRPLYGHRNGIFWKYELVRFRVPRTLVSYGFMPDGADLPVNRLPIDSPPQRGMKALELNGLHAVS